MTCRCGERREAMKRAWEARARGDLDALKHELRFIAQSSIDDMKSALAPQTPADRDGEQHQHADRGEAPLCV